MGWTNLKKSPGSKTAKPFEIAKAAHEQYDLWRKELAIMAPQVIIFAGTCNLAKAELKDQLKPAVTLNGREYSFWQMKEYDCLCVDFYHHGIRQSYDYYISGVSRESVADKLESLPALPEKVERQIMYKLFLYMESGGWKR